MPGRLRRLGVGGVAATVALAWFATLAAAQGVPAAPPRIERPIAVWRMDALGIEREIVDRLEALFRIELERLATTPIPSRREVDRQLRKSRLRNCDGSTKCLAAIGVKLGVELVVSGNVAALGNSYVINLKLVDATSGEELRRIVSDPLRGSPDELIEAVRVAAYRLVAPEHLRGSIAVLTDLVGATVTLDGKPVGATPLPNAIDNLELGEYELKVTAEGYTPFAEKVRVRFQKTTRVVVRLVLADQPTGPLIPDPKDLEPLPAPKPWYSSPWFYVGVGVAAVVVGGYVGYRLGHDPVIDCTASPDRCSP